MNRFWKEDWDTCRANLAKWWRHQGPAVCVVAPKDQPWEQLPEPQRPENPTLAFTDPVYRFRKWEYELSRTYFGGEAFPYFDAHLGPGSLGMVLGAEPHFALTTVWYEPFIEDPDVLGPIRFDPQNRWFKQHVLTLETGRRMAQGRFLVGMPDLIENVDTLAQMRGSETLLMDMIERPQWVERCVAEINQAYFELFDALYPLVEEFGGNAFSAFKIWGPGKTTKLQCDASAMFSPAMFERFVLPALAEQCRRLDFCLYHLDGTQALCHLDLLLGIEGLAAIQWTPQTGLEGAGHPRWYDLYRRMLKAGKGVQALFVQPDQVVPLLEAVGPEGVFVHCTAPDESSARRLLDEVEVYRR